MYNIANGRNSELLLSADITIVPKIVIPIDILYDWVFLLLEFISVLKERKVDAQWIYTNKWADKYKNSMFLMYAKVKKTTGEHFVLS